MHAAVLKLPMVIHKKADSIDTSFQIFSHTICRKVYHKLESSSVSSNFSNRHRSNSGSGTADSNALLNSDSVIVVICLGLKSQLMEQRLVLSDVSLTIQDITINVESIQELFKSCNHLFRTSEPVGRF